MKHANKTEEQLDSDLTQLRQKAAESEKLKAEHKRVVEELREARAELAIKVKVRTAEITKANEDLHRDIAERKRIEAELRETKERLEYILGVTKTNVDVIDSAFNLRYVDPTWQAIYGAPAGRKCYEYFMGRSEFCPTCGIPVALKTHNITVTKEVLPRENNRVIEVHTIPFQDQSGEWMVAEFNIDITERKKAEEALRDSEDKYRSIVENTTDVIMLTRPDGIISYLSPACQAVLGYSPDELTGKQPWIIYPQDLQKVKEAHYRSLKGESRTNFEYRVITKDGKIKWVWHSWSPIIEDNKLQMIVSMIKDITERKEVREKLERLNREILLSNKRLKQLSLRDSHTGLYNHRYLEEIIEVEFDKAKRYGSPLSVIMLDIDYFKSINDAYGHQFGDLVLFQLAEQLKKKLRRYDVIIRYGGEEFVILSPITDRSTAMILAQRLLESLNLHSFGNRKQKVRLKLSFAVVSYPESRAVKGIDLIEHADKILNYAKEFGGNRVYSYLDMKKGKAPPGARNGKEPVGVKYLREKIDKLNKRANQSLIESIFAFAKTIELKDKHTGRHVELTVKYATDVAKKLKLSAREIDNIRQASILHDLGKIGISEKILLKRAKLTKEEFEEIKKHPQIGVDIIRPLHFLHDIIPLILYHHERWDGSGYPHGLKGEDIPIGARIIAVADAYQALTSHRSYRKAYSKRRALQIIRQESGTHFDPLVTKVFLEILNK